MQRSSARRRRRGRAVAALRSPALQRSRRPARGGAVSMQADLACLQRKHWRPLAEIASTAHETCARHIEDAAASTCIGTPVYRAGCALQSLIHTAVHHKSGTCRQEAHEIPECDKQRSASAPAPVSGAYASQDCRWFESRSPDQAAAVRHSQQNPMPCKQSLACFKTC